MDTPFQLPVELMDEIVHIIRTDATESGDIETLKACSCVFSGWRVFFQSALLETKGVCLTFSSSTTAALRFGVGGTTLDSQRKKVRALRDLLDDNPSFGKAITSLILQIVDEECLGESNSALTVASIISLLTNVRTLSFSRFDSDDLLGTPGPRKFGSWSTFPSNLKEAIAGLFRSPSLKNLTVASFDGPLDIMLPENSEIDTLTLGLDVVPARIPRSVEDVGPVHMPASNTNALPFQISTRPCIVRHLVAKSPCAAYLLLATTHSPHLHPSTRRSVVDASAIQSLKLWGTRRDLDAQGSQVALERAINLKIFTTFAGIPRLTVALAFSFQEPHPPCFTRQLEDMKIIFRYYGYEPGRNIDYGGAGLKKIAMELDAYPPNNVLKRLTLKVYFGWRLKKGWLVERQELIDSSIDLARTLGARSKFPVIQFVLLQPVVCNNIWSPQETLELRMEGFLKDIEHIEVVLGDMNLPFSFNVLKPRLANGRAEKDRGLDRDDSRWYESLAQDNIAELQGGRS